jgi:hypothetical protein
MVFLCKLNDAIILPEGLFALEEIVKVASSDVGC